MWQPDWASEPPTRGCMLALCTGLGQDQLVALTDGATEDLFLPSV